MSWIKGLVEGVATGTDGTRLESSPRPATVRVPGGRGVLGLFVSSVVVNAYNWRLTNLSAVLR